MASKTTDNNDGLAGLLSAVLAQGQIVHETDNATDDLSNNVMAASLVIIAVLGTQLKSGQGDWRILTIIAMLILTSVIGVVFYAGRKQEYRGLVVDLKRHKEYFDMENSVLLAQLIKDIQQANDDNSKTLAAKQRLTGIAGRVFLCGFALGIVSLFVNA